MRNTYSYGRSDAASVLGVAIAMFFTCGLLVLVVFISKQETKTMERKRFESIVPVMSLKPLNDLEQKTSDSLRAIAWKKYHHNQGDE